MNCVVCHGEDVEVREVREEVSRGNDVVYVPVRVPVCQTCGERYFDRRTMRYLEDVEQKLKEGRVNLAEVGKVMELSEEG